MKILGWLLLLFLLNVKLQGTHIRGGEITYKRISDVTLIYEFTFTGFSDTGSPVRFGDGLINFGDGNETQIDLAASSFEDGLFLGKHMEVEVYRIKIIHTFNSPGVYTISYLEPNRNDEIVNINHGNAQLPFYIESQVAVDPAIGLNSSPVLTSVPADFGFAESMFTHNPWALDAEGDSLVYRLITPLDEGGLMVENYQKPNHTDFYQAPLDWSFANENSNGAAQYKINPFTGDLIWDSPGNLFQNSRGQFSEYSLALLVEEWRKIGGSWRKLGHVIRDFSVLVTPDDNGRPDFKTPEDRTIASGETVIETITFSDPDNDAIKVEFFGDVFSLSNSPMMISVKPADFVTGPLEVTLKWVLLPEHARQRPYYVHMKITDNPVDSESPRAVTYKTWILSFSTIPDVITALPTDKNSARLSLYPNPSKKFIRWDHESNGSSDFLLVFNSLGQQTFYADLTSNGVKEIDVSRFQPGLYFAELFIDGEIYREPFIKE